MSVTTYLRRRGLDTQRPTRRLSIHERAALGYALKPWERHLLDALAARERTWGAPPPSINVTHECFARLAETPHAWRAKGTLRRDVGDGAFVLVCRGAE